MSSENSPKLSKLVSKVKIRSWSISISEVALFLPWVKIRLGSG